MLVKMGNVLNCAVLKAAERRPKWKVKKTCPAYKPILTGRKFKHQRRSNRMEKF
jgi:hypothetical protein